LIRLILGSNRCIHDVFGKSLLGAQVVLDYTILPPVGSEDVKMIHMLTFGGLLNVVYQTRGFLLTNQYP